MFSQVFQNIIGSLQFYGHLTLALFYFLRAYAGRSVISYCCGLDDHVLFITDRSNCLIHIPGSHYRYCFYEKRWFDSSTSADQRNICSTKHSHLRNGIAHFSRRMVGNITYRINCFLCRSCCDQDLFACQILLPGDLSLNISKQSFRFRHLTGSCISACQISAGRSDHFISVMLQDLQIILYNRVFKHIGIHGWRNEFLTFTCHDGGSEHIISNAMRQLADHIGTCRGDHHHVCFLRNRYMLHLKLDKDAAKQRTLEIMRKVGISDPESRYNQYPQHFSGGMRQRIMIAMAIAAEPEVLIADEATTALDVTTQAQILDLLQELARDKGFSIIIVTHNLGLVARYADRIYVMYGGNIVESGDKFTLFENPIHPYTRGLLDAIPRLDDSKDRRLTPIEGNPPSPVNRKPYCQFYDRCRYREDRCTRCAAPLTEYEPGHKVRCLLSSAELDEKQKHLVRSGKAVAKKTVSTEPILQVEGLKMYFPVYKGLMKRKVADVKALDDVSFSVYRGETLGIVGESGCGKSTLARCIMRAYKPTGGQILYDGKDLCRANAAELRRVHAKIAMIFQDPFASLDPRQNAGSIVGEPLKVGKLCNSREEYNARVDELLTMVGLDPSFKHRVPREFSGGQRQRLGIARAIASRPDVILCDEPVSALDVSIQAQVINLLEDLQAELGITYLFIAHDLSVVKHISDRIIVMYLGKIMEIAPCEELYSHPLHPYTRALLSAVPIADPKVDKDRERIEMLGEVPSVMNRPAGCPFSNRCRYATERCRTETPPMRSVGADHSIACFLDL